MTLVSVTGVALGPTIQALRASMAQVDFGEVLLLSHRSPPTENSGIHWRKIDPIRSRDDYSRFMLHQLVDHLQTPHALCIQWDGYVLNGDSWTKEFLDYDYIGAPWPHFHDAYRVGNGGFSLRSKRLLEACRKLPVSAPIQEDVLIGRRWRPGLEEQGIRFAPEPLARRFAYERMAPTGHEFGFHGAFNLRRHVSPARLYELFQGLEPTLLARNERWEIFWWALRKGHLRIASEMFRRLT